MRVKPGGERAPPSLRSDEGEVIVDDLLFDDADLDGADLDGADLDLSAEADTDLDGTPVDDSLELSAESQARDDARKEAIGAAVKDGTYRADVVVVADQMLRQSAFGPKR